MRIQVIFYLSLFVIIIAVMVKLNIHSAPPRTLLAKDAVLLAFGDSLTFGYGADPNESYPAQLEQRIHRKVINAGISGELSEQGKQRLTTLLERDRPAILLLCHGGNDILQNKNLDVMRTNLEAMIQSARQRGVVVLLIAVPEPALVRMEPSPVYTEVAERFGLLYERDVLSDILHESRYKSDTIHPNASGYEKMAEAVERKLREKYQIEE